MTRNRTKKRSAKDELERDIQTLVPGSSGGVASLPGLIPDGKSLLSLTCPPTCWVLYRIRGHVPRVAWTIFKQAMKRHHNGGNGKILDP